MQSWVQHTTGWSAGQVAVEKRRITSEMQKGNFVSLAESAQICAPRVETAMFATSKVMTPWFYVYERGSYYLDDLVCIGIFVVSTAFWISEFQLGRSVVFCSHQLRKISVFYCVYWYDKYIILQSLTLSIPVRHHVRHVGNPLQTQKKSCLQSQKTFGVNVIRTAQRMSSVLWNACGTKVADRTKCQRDIQDLIACRASSATRTLFLSQKAATSAKN